VVLLLDDVHWADKASAELLGHLITTTGVQAPTRDVRLAIVLAHRLTMTEAALGRTLDRAAREPMTRRIELDGLGPLEVNDLVVSATGLRPSRALLTDLMRSSGGNPLVVLSLLDRLEAFGALSRRAGTLIRTSRGEVLGLPPGLDAVLQDRLASLPPSTLNVLTTASFVGDEMTHDELAVMSGLDPAELDRRLVEAIDAGLLLDDNGHYRFSHPQLRQLLYHRPRGRRREAMHRQLADRIESALADDPRYTARLAHHLRAGGADVDPDRLARCALAAATSAAAIGAWSEAWQMYETALDAMQDDPFPSALHALVNHRAAIAAWWDHDTERAKRHADAAITHARALGYTDRWGAAAILAARSGMSSGVSALGARIETMEIDACLDAIGNGSDGLRAELHAELGELHNNVGDIDAAQAEAATSWELAVASGDERVQRTVVPSIAVVHLGALDMAAALEWYERGAAPLPEGVDPLPRIWCAVRLGLTSWMVDDLERARHQLEAAAGLARESLAWANEAMAAACLVGVASAIGDRDDAEHHAAHAEVLWRWSDFGFAPTILYPALAAVRAADGDRDGAHEAIDSLVEAGGRGSWRYRHLIDLRCGRDDEVRAEVERRPLPAAPSGRLNVFELPAVAALVEVALRLDRAELVVQAAPALAAAVHGGVVRPTGWPVVLADLLAEIDGRTIGAHVPGSPY
jgi:tetratricopeptide (TPR) repeat protein